MISQPTPLPRPPSWTPPAFGAGLLGRGPEVAGRAPLPLWRPGGVAPAPSADRTTPANATRRGPDNLGPPSLRRRRCPTAIRRWALCAAAGRPSAPPQGDYA